MSLGPRKWLAIYPPVDEYERALRRERLNLEVEQMVGPIIKIERFSDAELYGMRDRLRRKRAAQ